MRHVNTKTGNTTISNPQQQCVRVADAIQYNLINFFINLFY
jgi:hypothetical protein